MILRTGSALGRLGSASATIAVTLLLFQSGQAFGQAQNQERAQQLQRRLDELNRALVDLRGTGEAAEEPAANGHVTLPSDWVDSLHWRSIGPASMSGRIVSFSVVEGDPSTYWVATAASGILKTTNNGITFEYQFSHENTFAIGDICHAPSNPDIVWVGTGEQNPIRSGSYGDGVYKSTDGGTTWKHMGLRDSFQIGRIAIHPTNPDIVYVGAQGRLYGPNEERGLYKTTNGGETWEKILHVNNMTGVVDVKMHPADPDTLLVATYDKQRDEYDGGTIPKTFGPGSGLWKTTDGGRTFERLSEGLGESDMGRIGISYCASNPDVIYANIEQRSRDEQGVYRSDDGGDSWAWTNSIIGGPGYYYSKIYCDPNDENRSYVLGVSTSVSTDGGQTYGRLSTGGVHSDHHTLWIDPDNSRHMLLGHDGGFNVTYDQGAAWDHLNHTAIGTFYHVAVDTRELYWVYGGLQDNGTWGAPNRTRDGTGLLNEDWISVGGGDGFVCFADPDDPDVVYSESQNGNMSRRNLRTGETARIRPVAEDGERYRFNWKTPMILSHHNSKIFYTAGNYVFRSLNRGDDLKRISPQITRNNRGAATALDESPLNSDVLYVGSEDGALWVTRDGGENWTNITYNVPLPGPRWVATLEASRYAEGRVYVTYDAHRSDDDNPYVFVSEDYGKNWTNITANLPWGSSRTCREDVTNENILYVGHEFGVYASLDRGRSWTKINSNLPTVSIHEIAVHETAGEIVVGTHGRSFWILDVTPLRQMTADTLSAKAHLYEPNRVIRWTPSPRRGSAGTRRFVGENPPNGAQLFYSLTQSASEVSLKVTDFSGNTLREIPIDEAGRSPGLHQVIWDGRAVPTGTNRQQAGRGQFARGGSQGRGRGQARGGAQARGGRGQARGGAQARGGRQGRGGAQARGGRQGRGRGRGVRGTPVELGTYQIVLTVDGQEFKQKVRILPDPEPPVRHVP